MTETRPDWAPASISLDVPSSARVWDYFLGGSHNFTALHFVSGEDDPAGIVAVLRDALAPGSFLAVQHATVDEQPPETIEMLAMWNANSPEPMFWRTRAEIEGLMAGFAVQEPGVVFLPCWRPEPGTPDEEHPERFTSYAALARLPE